MTADAGGGGGGGGGGGAVEEAQEAAAPVVEALEAVAPVAEALEAEDPVGAVLVVAASSADRRLHSEVLWIRATRYRNPRPTPAPQVRTLRQEVLPVGCSLHINACPRRRFRIPTGAPVFDLATTPVCAAQGLCAAALLRFRSDAKRQKQFGQICRVHSCQLPSAEARVKVTSATIQPGGTNEFMGGIIIELAFRQNQAERGGANTSTPKGGMLYRVLRNNVPGRTEKKANSSSLR